MGYQATHSLEEFGAAGLELFPAAMRRTVERAGEFLHDKTVEHTPVAKPPPGAAAEWEEARKRAPGHLRDSWKVGEVTVEDNGRRMTIDVYTRDPVAPHVEYPTRPHLIHARPGGMLRWWDAAGRKVFALLVHHPGTQGSYMLATASGELALEWERMGREELDAWARGVEARI